MLISLYKPKYFITHSFTFCNSIKQRIFMSLKWAERQKMPMEPAVPGLRHVRLVEWRRLLRSAKRTPSRYLQTISANFQTFQSEYRTKCLYDLQPHLFNDFLVKIDCSSTTLFYCTAGGEPRQLFSFLEINPQLPWQVVAPRVRMKALVIFSQSSVLTRTRTSSSLWSKMLRKGRFRFGVVRRAL